MKTSSTNNNKVSIHIGGCRLKRVPITIQFKKNPENMATGYALSHEILPNQVSFFATQKFPVDEELTIFFSLNGEKQSLTVTMKSMNEQISTGRIMNTLPSEAVPCPTRKFYRCYSAVMGAAAAHQPATTEAAPAITNVFAAAEDPATAAIPEAGNIAPVELPIEEVKAA